MIKLCSVRSFIFLRYHVRFLKDRLLRPIFLTNPSMWVPAQHMSLVVGNMECHTVRPLTQIAWQNLWPFVQ